MSAISLPFGNRSRIVIFLTVSNRLLPCPPGADFECKKLRLRQIRAPGGGQDRGQVDEQLPDVRSRAQVSGVSVHAKNRQADREERPTEGVHADQAQTGHELRPKRREGGRAYPKKDLQDPKERKEPGRAGH